MITTDIPHERRVLILLIAVIAAIVSPMAAQDTRDVHEPAVPQTCVRLNARLIAERGVLPDNAETTLDTGRIQDALDHCVAGRAVELSSDGLHNAFIAGPIELRPSVSLVVDDGVTLFATRNPRAYDVQNGSCGVVNDDGRGCKPLIHVLNSPHSGVMGLGTIDGQGGAKLLNQEVSWWDLAHQAKVEDKRQNCPRLVVAESSDDFTLYGITLKNSPNFHVIVSRSDGFTAWAVRIDAPATARNTDGIDPSSSTNVTIAYSYIRAGDDNVAIKAGKAGPATHMTIAHNHFYSGHGMSIGSETNGGVSAIRVSDLTIDGADNGIRIKSDRSRGGLVRDVSYENVCMREVKNPLVMDPFYSNLPGDFVPRYEDITLRNVHDVNAGKIKLIGFDVAHLLKLVLDGVYMDGVRPEDVEARHARVALGPAGTNIDMRGSDVEVQGNNKQHPLSCKDAFVPFPDRSTATLQRQSANALFAQPKTPVAGNRHSATVAADGSGDYRTVQQAIDSLSPKGGSVAIKPGTYREVVHIGKPHVRMVGTGESPDQVTIVFDNSAGMAGSTFKSATAFVTADDFYARNLTFQNDFSKKHQVQPQGSQAVALSITGDRAVFRNVRILGAQDTLYAASRSCQSEDGPCIPARQYFADCYIEGHVDFIFGDSQAVFDHCEIHALAHPVVMLTAQSRHYPTEPSGYVFDHCKVTSDPEAAKIFLGRPWRTYATVIFLNTEMDARIDPAGWSEWHAEETRRLESAYYAEYNSSGSGANPGAREKYAHQLSSTEAEKYKPANFLAGSDGWNPLEVR